MTDVKYFGNPCKSTLISLIIPLGYYRGTVIEADDKYCKVLFVDYGNIQKDIRHELLSRDVMCSEIPPVAETYTFEGTPMGSEGIDNELLDMLYQIAVESYFNVIVNSEDLLKTAPFIKRISVSLKGETISNYDDIRKLLDESEK